MNKVFYSFSFPHKTHYLSLIILSQALLPISIHAAPNDQESANTEMETITVTSSAIKVSSELSETARSVSIIDQTQLQDYQPNSIDEALRYQSGIVTQPYGSDTDTDWFKIRGFDAATYLDGNRLYTTGYYVWTLEPFGLESIEVIKGPDAILFGDAPPGGVVNAISKRPQNEDHNRLQLQFGNQNHQQFGFDFNRTLNNNNAINFRLVGALEKQDGVLDGSDNQRIYIAPSLSWDLSEKTTLIFLSSYKKDHGVPTNGFFPAYGTVIETPEGQIDPSTNLGEPDYDRNNNEQFSIGYELEHLINETWTFKQKARYASTDLFLRSTYAFPNNSSSDLSRGLVYRDGRTETFSIDNQFLADWYSDQTENTTLFGIEVQQFQTKSKELDDYGVLTGGINAFHPNYGNYIPTNTNTNFNHIESKRQQIGIYAQQITQIGDHWVFRLGGRYDFAQAENRMRNFTENHFDKNDYENFSSSAAIMYQFSSGLTPYLSYSESFEVLTGIDPATQSAYRPLKGQQIELGLKYEPESFDGYISAALFDIKQENALVTNPNTYVQTQTGALSSQGLELDVAAQFTDNLFVQANYTYTDARTDETYGNGRNQQAGIIPRHMASTWLEYSFQSGRLSGLVIGAGARYNGSSIDNPASSDLKVPSSLIFDAMAKYEINDSWQLQMNINNLTNETYISSCDYYCYYGEELSFKATLSYQW